MHASPPAAPVPPPARVAPAAPIRRPHAASIRQRRRWAVLATTGFIIASGLMMLLAELLVPAAVSHNGVHVTAADEAYVDTMRQKLAHGGDTVGVQALVETPWDTVCVIHPFELSAATIDEALAASHMPARNVPVASGLARISDTDWVFAFLEGATLVHVVRFNHHHVEIRDSGSCRARDDAMLVTVSNVPGASLKVAFEH